MDQEQWKKLRQELEPLQKSWPSTLVLAVDAAALDCAWELSARDSLARLAGSALLTLVLLHAYLWVHEASHSTISSNKFVNDLLGHVAGWLIALPYLTRRRSHLLHHVWTGHPTGDPANKRLIERFAVMTEKQAAALQRIWSSWIPLLALNDRVGLWRDAKQQRRQKTQTKGIERELAANRLYGAAYLAVLGSLLAAGELTRFVTWYVPALLVQLFLEELVNAPHHAETPLLHAEDQALPYWEQDRVTHSCRSVPVWSSLVLLNFNLHTAHHFFPKAPWSSLPRIQRELSRYMPQLEGQQTTSHELAWSLKNRRIPILKLMGHYFDRVPKPELHRASLRPTEEAVSRRTLPPSLRPPPPQQAAQR